MSVAWAHGARPAPEVTLAEARSRIGRDEIRAWVAIVQDEQTAAWRPESGALAGWALGVKDIIDLAGLPTRCGSSITADGPATRSASLVERLVGLGAVPVGKTVTTEFAYFAPGPTENPRAPGHTPGGSSSGSAAAVAAGHVPLALGSQTAGSLIRPASYCGVAGLVLRHGAVPLDGFSGLASSLDAAGLVTSTVEDLERVYRALSPDAREPRMVRRVLVWRGDDAAEVSPDMRVAVERAAAVLRASGVVVETLGDELHMSELSADHLTVMAYEVARERADLAEARSQLSPPLRELIEGGQAITDAEYASAVERTAEHRCHLERLLGESTAILGPGATGAAPVGLGATGSPVMSRPWQLLGVPQLAVPGNVDPAGVPLGVQLIARGGEEAMLLSTGRALEDNLVKH